MLSAFVFLLSFRCVAHLYACNSPILRKNLFGSKLSYSIDLRWSHPCAFSRIVYSAFCVSDLNTSSRLWLSLCKETMLRLCSNESSKICLRSFQDCRSLTASCLHQFYSLILQRIVVLTSFYLLIL